MGVFKIWHFSFLIITFNFITGVSCIADDTLRPGASNLLQHECKQFGAHGSVTKDGVTLVSKGRDGVGINRNYFSPRKTHAVGATVDCRRIKIPQAPVTYKIFGAQNCEFPEPPSAVELGSGMNEYGLIITDNQMTSWDNTGLLSDNEYIRLALERRKNALEAIELYDELNSKYGYSDAQSYLLADPNELWLLETSGHNWVAKPVINDVVSTRGSYTIGTDWNDNGNKYNSAILENAKKHGCNTQPLNWAVCFGQRVCFGKGFCFGKGKPPSKYARAILDLKKRGDITIEDMRALVQDATAEDEAIVGLTRPSKDPAYYTVIWDSRANPQYGNIFIPRWIAMDSGALPQHYTSWTPQDPEAAHLLFNKIVDDKELREKARPTWQALQSKLYAEFSTVETNMQNYIENNDNAGLQKYINDYIYRTSEDAYKKAMAIINGTANIITKSRININFLTRYSNIPDFFTIAGKKATGLAHGMYPSDPYNMWSAKTLTPGIIYIGNQILIHKANSNYFIE